MREKKKKTLSAIAAGSMFIHEWIIVNGQPCMPNGAACCRHRETYVTMNESLFFQCGTDTKVWGHGWRRRNSTNIGLHSLMSFTIFARCEGILSKTMYII